MVDEDTSTTSADGKPIKVSGNLKKSYFAETVKNDGKKSDSKSSDK